MAGDLTLKLKLIADEKAATQALKSAQRETKILANNAVAATTRARAMGKAYQVSGDQGFAAMVKMQQGLAGIKTQMLALVAGGGALQLGGNIIEQADAYKQLESRVRLVTESEEQLKEVQGLLMSQAQENRAEIAAVTKLYAGVTPVLKEMGRSQSEILSLTDAVSKSLQIGGATAAESSSAILQLTQAMGSGVLRGDEFNSLMENAPALMRSFADSLGMPVGNLRKLSSEGKLTSELLTDGILSQSAAIAEQYAKIDVTVGSAMVTVKNSIGDYIGETDKALGFTSALSAGLQALASDLSIAGNAAVAIGAVGIGRMIAASAKSEDGMIRRMKLRKAEAVVATQAAATEAAAEQSLQVAKANTAKMELQSALRKNISTRQALQKAKASFAEAKAEHVAASAHANTAASSHVAARSADAYAASLARLKVAQMASTAASGTLSTARKAAAVANIAAANGTAKAAATYSVAGRAIAVASGAAGMAASGLSKMLMLVGGPVGAALLAATTIYAYRQELMDLIGETNDVEQATLNHKEAMEEAKTAAYLYAGGSKELKEKIEEEGQAAQKAAEEQLKLADARLTAARAAMVEAKQTKMIADESAIASFDPRAAVREQFQADDQVESSAAKFEIAEAAFDAQKKHIEELRKSWSNLGKTKKELSVAYKDDGSQPDGSAETKKLKDLLKLRGDELRAFIASKEAKSKANKSGLSDQQKLEKAQIDEMAGLQATHDQLLLNNQAYYAQSLALKKFAPDVIAAANGLKYQNTLLKEQQSLQAARTGLSPKITAQYEVDLQKKGLNPDDIKALADQKIKISFEAGYLDLRDQQQQLALTDEGYRRATLAAQGYDEVQVDALVSQGNMNNRLEAQYALLQEEIALRPKLTAQYEIDLESKGVDKASIQKFSNEKIRLSFEALKKGLAETSGQLDLGAVAYRKASLEAKGYTEQQIKVVQGLEASNKAKAAIKSVEESLKNDRTSLTSTLTIELEAELNDAGVDQETIGRLAGEKIGIAFDDLKQGLEKTNQELLVGEKAYRAIDLAAQGYGKTQISEIQRLESVGKARAAIKSAEDSLKSGARPPSKKITADFEGDLEDAGVGEKTVKRLSDAKIKQAFDGITAGLKDSNKELEVGKKAYREIDLAAQGFNETQVKEILRLESVARARTAIQSVEKSLETGDRDFSKKITVDLEFDLKEAGVDKDTIDRLAGEKIAQSFKGLSSGLDEASQKLSLGAVAYRGIELAAQGYGVAQVEIIQNKEIKNAFDGEVKALRESNKELELGKRAYQAIDLAAKGYNETQVKEIQRLQSVGKARAAIKAAEKDIKSDDRSSSKKITANFEVGLQDAGVGEKTIKRLSDAKIKQAFDGITAGLKGSNKELEVGKKAYQALDLAAKGYNETQVKEIQRLEGVARARTAIQSVEKSLDSGDRAFSKKITVGLEFDLKEAGVDKGTIEKLAGEKIQQSFKGLSVGLDEASQKLSLGAVAYRGIELAAQGYGVAQVEIIQNKEIKNSFDGEVKALKASNKELELGKKAYEAIDLAAKGYNETQVKEIQRLQSVGKARAAIKAAEKDIKSDDRSSSKKITANFEVGLQDAGVGEKTIKRLSDAKIKQAFDGITAGLKDSNKELEVGKKAYQAIDLAAKGYSETQVKEIQRLEGVARARTAIQSVEKSLDSGDRAFSKKLTVDLEFDLKAAGVDKDTIEKLAGEKIQQSFKGLSISLDDANQKLNLGAVAYRGIELAALGYGEAQSKIIQNKEIKNAFDGEVKALKESNKQLGLNARQQYAASQSAKGLTGELLKQVTSLEYSNALTAERNLLEASRAKIGVSQSESYQQDYQDKGFSVDDSKGLAIEKVGQDFDKMKQGLQDNRNEILMTADAYRELGLTMENGFTAKQASVIVGLENQNKSFAKWKDFTTTAVDSVGNSIDEMVRTGETDWKGLVANMIAEAFKLAVIQPMIDNIKNSLTSAIGAASGGGGGWGGLLASLIPFEQGGAFAGAGGPQFYAQGGAFTNQVVSSPTAFVGGGKLSVMGEAGPEVIMPLTRTSTGNMGVEVDLAGTPPVTINMAPQITVQPAPAVLLNPPAEVGQRSSEAVGAIQGNTLMTINLIEDASKAGTVERSTDSQGRQAASLFVADIRGQGKQARALEAAYGLKRRGTH